jgi:hypothetical protein
MIRSHQADVPQETLMLCMKNRTTGRRKISPTLSLAVVLALNLFAVRAQAADAPSAVPLASQDAPADETLASVNISSARDPDWKPYRQMVKGVDAFERLHAKAPAANLHFVLRPQQSGLSLADVSLRIAGDQTSTPVPVDADGRFTLPRVQAALDENADMVLNKKKGLYRWRPDVRTPNLPANVRRMGDLRLECEVRWAVEYDDIGFVMRNMFRALGGPCNTARVNVIFPTEKPLLSLTLVSGEKRVNLLADAPAKERRSYWVPLHDASWPDDTLVELGYAN